MRLRERHEIDAEARPADGERLWIDEPGAMGELRRRRLPRKLAARVKEVIETGATRIEGAIPAETCDRLLEDFERYCREEPQAAERADAHGHHPRLTNFHLGSEAARAVGFAAPVMDLLDALLGYRTAVYSSLLFEVGTQQDLHRDAPFFVTEPRGHFFGVWTALEDIQPDAGPLVYFAGGHRVEVDELAVGARHAEEQAPDYGGELFAEYCEAVEHACADTGLELVTPPMSKGDTLVWHPDLPHGGSPIGRQGATRKSIVFHCTVTDSPLSGPDRFFAPQLHGPLEHTYIEADGRELVDHGFVSFADS